MIICPLRIAFPYFNKGSEEFYIDREGNSLYEASKIALDMHLPIAQNYLNRTSIHQTINLIQLLSDPLIPKEVIKDLKDDRSFLLVTVGNQFEEDEKRIIQQSRLILKNGDVTLYDLPLSAFKQQIPNIDSLKAINGVRKINGLNLSSSNNNILWKNFQGLNLKNKKHLLSLFDINNFPKNESIEVSLWINILQNHAAFPILYVDVLNENQQIIDSYECDPKISTDVIQQQVRAKIIVPYSAQNHRLRIRMEGKEQSLNSLLIRPLHQAVWIKDKDGKEYFNNFPL